MAEIAIQARGELERTVVEPVRRRASSSRACPEGGPAARPASATLPSVPVTDRGTEGQNAGPSQAFWRYLGHTMFDSIAAALTASDVLRLFLRQADEAQKEKRDYLDKLEAADRESV